MRKVAHLRIPAKATLIACLAAACLKALVGTRRDLALTQMQRPVAGPVQSEIGFSATTARRPRSLNGISPWGEEIATPPHWKGIGAFIIREDHFAGDVALWNGIALARPPDSEIGLRGFCDGAACIVSFRHAGRLLPRFQIVASGVYSTMRLLALGEKLGVAAIYIPLRGSAGTGYLKWADLPKPKPQIQGFLFHHE